MIVDLPSLVDPLTEAEFLTRLQQRRLTLIRGAGPERYEALLGWQTLNHLIGSSVYPLDQLRIVRESIPVPPSFYVRDGRIDPAALSRLMDQGVSLVFNRVDDYVPAVRRLCRNIAIRTGEQISAGAIVTSGSGGALERHFDYEDIVILQIAGTKRWQVYDPPVLHPARGMPETKAPRGAAVLTEVLQPGDLLFLPAGHWHHCENGPERSLHAGIFFDPPSGRHLVTALAREWLSDDIFRRPLTRHGSADALAAHEIALKAHLVDKVRQLSIAAFLAERASHLPGEISLEGADEPAPVGARQE